MKVYRRSGDQVAAGFALLMLICSMAQACFVSTGTYGFDVIPATVKSCLATSPRLDLGVEVGSYGPLVQFKFTNDSTIRDSITQIFFDDHCGILSGLVNLNWGFQTGISYHAGACGNLPGGDTLTPPFIVTDPARCFSAAADCPVIEEGINPGQWLIMSFGLKSGKSLNDVLSALDNECLRIGIHVQGFCDCTCASYVTPEPATITLTGMGLIACLRRKK